MISISPTLAEDVTPLMAVVEATGLFSPAMLPQMVEAHLSAAPTDSIWLTCRHDGVVIGFCFAVPEALTSGTWNMQAIAIHPEWQGLGAGGALVAALETRMRAMSQRLLIVDTSGKPEFERTRRFYRNIGFYLEAVIRDFWAAGDDKVTFWKSIH